MLFRSRGIRGEIQELKDVLESMTACLRDLADDDDHNEQTRTWMKQVREAAFDVEDCMDRFCHHLSENHGDRQGLLEYLHRMFNMVRTLRVRHKMATDIQGLKSRAQKVSDRRLRYTYTLGDSAGRSGRALDTYSHLDNLDRWLPAIHDDGSGLVGRTGHEPSRAELDPSLALARSGAARLGSLSQRADFRRLDSLQLWLGSYRAGSKAICPQKYRTSVYSPVLIFFAAIKPIF